jgi:DNA-binding protein Fis
MTTTNIRQQLHNYLEVADDKKLNAIYTMVEDEIKETMVEYSPEFKAELNNRVNYYLNGGKMIFPIEMNRRLQVLRKKRK